MSNQRVILVIVIACLSLSLSACSFRKNTDSEQNVNKDTKNLIEQNKDVVKEANNPQSMKKVRDIDNTDWVRGNISAPVKLIVYSDFDCPFCAEFEQTLKQAQEKYQDKLAIAFRHNPLRSHPMAYTASLSAECAGEQNKFWEMHDKIFAANSANALNDDQIKADAKELGLDVVKFAQCVESEKFKDKIQEQYLEAVNLNVIGAPGSFLNGKPLSGAVPMDDYTASDGRQYEGLAKLIDKELNQ